MNPNFFHVTATSVTVTELNHNVVLLVLRTSLNFWHTTIMLSMVMVIIKKRCYTVWWCLAMLYVHTCSN